MSIGPFKHQEIPSPMLRDYRRQGGRNLQMLWAVVDDGYLNVMAGKEPLERFHRRILHVSVSVGGGPIPITPKRRPTDEEIEAVKSGLFSLVEFEEDNSGSTSPLVRNLWEVAK